MRTTRSKTKNRPRRAARQYTIRAVPPEVDQSLRRIAHDRGIGYNIHAGMVCVADGTTLADQRLERVLTCDPAMGVFRHVDAGYERAEEVANERGVNLPS